MSEFLRLGAKIGNIRTKLQEMLQGAVEDLGCELWGLNANVQVVL